VYRVVCVQCMVSSVYFFFFQAEDGIRDWSVTGVQTCALPILVRAPQDLRVGGPPFDRIGGEPVRIGALDLLQQSRPVLDRLALRSEERRVGKEGKSRGAACY